MPKVVVPKQRTADVFIQALKTGVFTPVLIDGKRIFTQKILQELAANCGLSILDLCGEINKAYPAVLKAHPDYKGTEDSVIPNLHYMALKDRILTENAINMRVGPHIGKVESEALVDTMAGILLHEAYREEQKSLQQAFAAYYKGKIPATITEKKENDAMSRPKAEHTLNRRNTKTRKFGVAADRGA